MRINSYPIVKCPEHDLIMIPSKTKYGIRLKCPYPNCDYVSWGNNPPANKETREYRVMAHNVFDSLWETSKERSILYKKLSKSMGIQLKKCHISRFNKKQCQDVIEWSKQMVSR